MRLPFLSAVIVAAAIGAAAAPEGNVFESTAPAAAETELDKIVFGRLAQLKVQPVLCSDAVFVRRVYLDVLGTLPTAREARNFILDTDESKRRQLIDRLLERGEFADYWAMRWGDVLRIKAEFPVNLWPNAAQAYHHWVRASIAQNKPYDKFARELLTSSGSNFRVGPVNFYRAIQNRTPEGIARAVALTLMGTRAETWPTNRLAGMAAFFSEIGYKPTGEWKEEHVFWDPLGSSRAAGNSAPGRASIAAIGQPSNTVSQATILAPGKCVPSTAVFPNGTEINLPPERDPREVFADWLIAPENPWFTRSIVNRVWAWLLGRGIIHEPDDIRPDNPPSNPELLAYLETEMIAGKYDLKHLYRIILRSQTYQLSSRPRGNTPEAAANFVSYPLRRLDAEVIIDAINKVTGSSDLYTSPIPEPFTYIPKGVPAVAIGDGSITSPFLALFGRSARASGMENERNNNPTPAQWLYLLNSTDIQRKIEQGTNLQAVVGFGSKPASRIVEELYLTILSRFPTPDEVRLIEAYGQPASAQPVAAVKAWASQTNAATNQAVTTSAQATNPVSVARLARARASDKAVPGKKREAWFDVAWSLINSEEFLYRH